MNPTPIRVALLCATCAILSACGGGGGGSATSTRTLLYSSSTDFETTEYSNQAGLAVVNSSDMYYRGHYRWYAQNGGTGGNPTSSDAGTGTGITVGVADSGINSSEASTGSQITINASASYDYVSGASGSGSDANGHGTHVAGIVAAPKNSSGMHGIAYNATIANYRIINAAGTVTATESQLAGMFNRAYANNVMIMNNSWGSSMKITDASAADLNGWYPNMIPALQSYVGNGGVVVFAAGNDSFTEPSIQAGMPYRISNIQAGWLAVVSVDLDGSFSSTFSNQCGVAAAYCLAAPGRAIYSMYNNGSYTTLSGTSMAAPHVSGAIAGLKSMFPSLSYQQIRDRLLTTANDSGIYADSAKYGAGLMDLDAASNPVGGLSIPTGSSVNGAVQPAHSSAALPPAVITKLGLSPHLIMVDGYQRAPFWIASSSVVSPSQKLPMASSQIRDLSVTDRLVAHREDGVSYIKQRGEFELGSGFINGSNIAFSRGVGAEPTFAKELDLIRVPSLNSAQVSTSTFGYSTDVSNNAKLGVLYTTRGKTFGEDFSQKPFLGMGGRDALSVVVETAHSPKTNFGFNYSLAKNFDRPAGISGSGAFGFKSSSAFGVGAAATHAYSDDVFLKIEAELNRFSQSAADLLKVNTFKLFTLKGSVDTLLDKRNSIKYSLRAELVQDGDAMLQLPTGVDESGDLTQESYRFAAGDLLSKYELDMNYSNQLSKSSALNVGLRIQSYPGVTGIAASTAVVYRRIF